MTGIRILPVEGLPEVTEGDDLAALIAGAIELEHGDVVVVAHKAVSKVEGRVLALDDIDPSAAAREIAGADARDPRQVEAVLSEAIRIVRRRGGLVIAETRHGFVCASAGVDASNAP
ncbi:MAG TPA: coenzyme F420-0:L-glutamate ligase, partial [Gaiellaceae bacterium]|nr:coenzyme F420-0:L-glutamate ligase [Gaiellaceae bacterium]